MNIKNTAWRQGYRDYIFNVAIDNCPFERYSMDWHFWISGWSAAQFSTEQ